MVISKKPYVLQHGAVCMFELACQYLVQLTSVVLLSELPTVTGLDYPCFNQNKVGVFFE